MSGGAKECAALWSAASREPGARSQERAKSGHGPRCWEMGQASAAPAECITESAGSGARLD